MPHAFSFYRLSPVVLLLVGAACLGAQRAPAQPTQDRPTQDRTVRASAMDAPDALQRVEGRPHAVPAGPEGTTVLRFDNRFRGHIDLGARDIAPRQYDLIKMQVKADRGAQLQVTLAGDPGPDRIAHWWVLDGLRGPLGWRTIWIDLRMVETLEDAPPPRTDADTTGGPTLTVEGFVKDLGRRAAAGASSIWIGEIRFVRRAVHLDWDQTRVSHSGGSGTPLTYTYPLRLTNERDRPTTATVTLRPVDVEHARAKGPFSVSLAPGETATVEATVTLPADVAARKPPLYTERFRAVARADGVPDSEVTILRSSDPVHLVATVPIPERRLRWPLFPPPDRLPGSILYFDATAARSVVARHAPQRLIEHALEAGLYNYSEGQDPAAFRKTLISAAYLYVLTDAPEHLHVAETLLAALPRIWDAHYAEWQRRPVRQIAAGIVARWDDGFHYTLGLGWRVAGTQRSPYQYSRDHNSAHGSMSALMYAFDMLAPHLSPSTRQSVVNGFLVPAALQCRNHYIGDGNQQATVNAVTLYAGLAARNWPLVAFAHNAQHGVHGILKWTFTDEGMHIRDGYQTYALRPLFWIGELLHGVGVPFYERHASRLREVVGGGFSDERFWQFVRRQRLPAK